MNGWRRAIAGWRCARCTWPALNYLGQRDLVSIRKWKSGLDYRRELERRARSNPEISPVFSSNVAIFERGWYGGHPVDREMVEEFTSGLTRIKSGLEAPR